jgi:4'-phosphopantetheinyl transferase
MDWIEQRLPLPILQAEAGRIDLFHSQPFPVDQEQLSTLSEAEIRRGQKMAEPIRDAFYCAQVTLRTVLSAYAGQSPKAIKYRFGPHGKPFLGDSDVQFNLTHSGSMTMIAVTLRDEVGVDVEEIRPIKMGPAIMKRYFQEPDRLRWENASAEEKDAIFCQLWTRLEAVGKAHGIGVSSSMSYQGIQVQELDLGEKFRGAVASFGQMESLTGYRLLWGGS